MTQVFPAKLSHGRPWSKKSSTFRGRSYFWDSSPAGVQIGNPDVHGWFENPHLHRWFDGKQILARQICCWCVWLSASTNVIGQWVISQLLGDEWSDLSIVRILLCPISSECFAKWTLLDNVGRSCQAVAFHGQSLTRLCNIVQRSPFCTQNNRCCVVLLCCVGVCFIIAPWCTTRLASSSGATHFVFTSRRQCWDPVEESRPPFFNTARIIYLQKMSTSHALPSHRDKTTHVHWISNTFNFFHHRSHWHKSKSCLLSPNHGNRESANIELFSQKRVLCDSW